MSDAYDADALWLKAKLFLNHAMDDDGGRTFDEQALWAALALELLGKAALSRHSPVLIAAPNEDGGNLLTACGLTKATDGFVSVGAKTLVKRCSKAFPPFSEREASAIMHARNDYLHGGSAVYTRIPAHAWWPKYWAQAEILVLAQDRSIYALVGDHRVELVEEYLAKNKQNIANRSQILIGRAQVRHSQLRAGTLSVKQAAELKFYSERMSGLDYFSDATCPACGAKGSVEGQAVIERDRQYGPVSDDDYDVWDELTVVAEYFNCPDCQLVLDSTELVAAAGIEDTFVVQDNNIDFGEPEYGND